MYVAYFYHEMNTGFSQEFFFVTKTHQSSPIILFIMSILSKGFFLTEFTGFTRWIFFCRGRFYIDPCIIETFWQKWDFALTIKHLLGLPLANALPHLHVRVSRWETLYLLGTHKGCTYKRGLCTWRVVKRNRACE